MVSRPAVPMLPVVPLPGMATPRNGAAGQQLFARCRARHSPDHAAGKRSGPKPYSILDRRTGGVGRFRRSVPMPARAAGGRTRDEATPRADLRQATGAP